MFWCSCKDKYKLPCLQPCPLSESGLHLQSSKYHFCYYKWKPEGFASASQGRVSREHLSGLCWPKLILVDFSSDSNHPDHNSGPVGFRFPLGDGDNRKLFSVDCVICYPRIKLEVKEPKMGWYQRSQAVRTNHSGHYRQIILLNQFRYKRKNRNLNSWEPMESKFPYKHCIKRTPHI